MIFRRLDQLLRGLVAILAILFIAVFLITTLMPTFGASRSSQYGATDYASKRHDGKRFHNTAPPSPRPKGELQATLKEQFFGTQVRVPPAPIPVIPIDPATLNNAAGLRAWWLGHSSVLLEIDGSRLLIDPVFSDRASPFNSLGPQRFHPTPISLEQLPAIAAVIISHDHYDHLDMPTVRFLAHKGTRFIVPLGIGKHLRRWNVAEDQIAELDWDQSTAIGKLSITSTEAQHYSGRGPLDYKQTLWSSWSIAGPEHNLFYSGDTGFSTHFNSIGNQYGPFDLTIIKIGAYGPGTGWTEVHMPVENAIDAHIALRGNRLLPVHWGTFNLGFHAWDEPIERALKAATTSEIDMVTPMVGEPVTLDSTEATPLWWRNIE